MKVVTNIDRRQNLRVKGEDIMKELASLQEMRKIEIVTVFDVDVHVALVTSLATRIYSEKVKLLYLLDRNISKREIE